MEICDECALRHFWSPWHKTGEGGLQNYVFITPIAKEL
jgi:hypothetical protein